MKRRLNWGVLGLARIARQNLIPAIGRCDEACLYAIASRSSEKLEEAGEFGFQRYFSSYEELLADPAVDVVYIPLPNSLHATWAIRAMEMGKHVLCEKPMAITAADAIRMRDTARRNSVFLMEAFMYRFMEKTRMVKDLVDSGAVGDVRMVKASWRFLLDRPGSIKLYPELGGGSAWDVGCYPVNLVGYLVGNEPESVVALKNMKGGVDFSLSALLKYPDGVMAELDCGFDSFSYRALEVSGSEGTLLVPEVFVDAPDSILLKRGRDGAGEEIAVPVQERYVEVVKAVSRAILEGKKELLPLDETIGNIRLLERILESAKE